MEEKTLFDYEPMDEFRAWPTAIPHMCIECVYLIQRHSQVLPDRCATIEKYGEELFPDKTWQWRANRSDRSDVQKIALRRCKYFEPRGEPEWWIKAQKKMIEGSIKFYKEHYTGD